MVFSWKNYFLYLFVGASFLLLIIPPLSVCTTTVSCIKIPGSKVPTDLTTYSVGDQSGRKSYGIEKFPQNIWDKYILDTKVVPWYRKSDVKYIVQTHGEFGQEFEFKDSPEPGELHEAYNFTPQVRVYTLHGREHTTEGLIQGLMRVELTTVYHLGKHQREGQRFADIPITQVIKSFILVATDEQANHVGEFTLDFLEGTESCPRNDATKHMIIPCSAVSRYEAIVPNMIMWVRNDSTKDGDIFPKKYKDQWPIVRNVGDARTLNFYFRMTLADPQKTKYKETFIRLIADFDDNFDQIKYLTPRGLLVNGLLQIGMRLSYKNGSAYGPPDPMPHELSRVDCSSRLWSPNPTILQLGIPVGTRPEDRTPWYISRDELPLMVTDWAYMLNQVLITNLDMKQGFPDCLSNSYFGGRCYNTRCKSSHATHIFAGKSDPPSLDNIPLVVHETTASHPKCKDINGTGCSWINLGTSGKSILYDFLNWKVPIDELWCVGEIAFKPRRYYETFHPGRPKNLSAVVADEKGFTHKQKCFKTEDDLNNIVARVTRHTRNQTTIDRMQYEKDKEEATGLFNVSMPIQPTSENKTHMVNDSLGVPASGYGVILYAVRKGHGVVMVVLSMFGLPLSIFVSRYYKETFMKTRVLSTPPWFQIHIHLSFWICALYIAGIAIAIAGRNLIGTSFTLAASAHRKLGWLSAVIFIVNLLGGGIRYVREPKKSMSIFVHWILGYITYLFNVLAIVTSVYIPGSASADNDVSMSALESGEYFPDRIYFVLAIWLAYELGMNIFMTKLIYIFDRQMNLEFPRRFIPRIFGVPIPVLKASSEYDTAGSCARKIILCIHIGIAALLNIVTAAVIISNKPSAEIGFGPMTCTHIWNTELSRYIIPDTGLDSKCLYKKK